MQGLSDRQPQVAGRRKVKTGCKTCKARRVKCDENRPACHRCVSTGRVCNGYGIWGGGDNQAHVHHSKTVSIYGTPIPLERLSTNEQMSIDWFKEKTTKIFAGMFNSDFWETLVFQAGAQEPAVRHAVVALSAAHRLDSDHGQSAIAFAHGFNAEQFMLQQYNKAIRHLRSSPTTNNKSNIRVTLITCMIFVTLEFLRGQYSSGSSHLRYGIELLLELSSPRTAKSASILSPRPLSPAEDFTHSALIDSYASLTIQSAMFGIVPSHMCVMARDSQANVPMGSFKSIIEARQTLDKLLNQVKCLKEGYYDTKHPRIPIDHAQHLSKQSKIQTGLSQWLERYNTFLTCLEPDISDRDRVGSIILRMYHQMAVIMAGVCLSENEMAFDEYTENFIAIMGGFYELQGFWSRKRTQDQDIGHGFTIESGYIPPVYYTAMKCRLGGIRRQAIHALQSMPHREGVWDASLLAHVLEEVINIEEGSHAGRDLRLYVPTNGSHIMENHSVDPRVAQTSRISDVMVLLPDTMKGIQGKAIINYKKITPDGRRTSYQRDVRLGVSSG